MKARELHSEDHMVASRSNSAAHLMVGVHHKNAAHHMQARELHSEDHMVAESPANPLLQWQEKENTPLDSSPLHWDHAVILTGLDVHVVDSNKKISSQVNTKSHPPTKHAVGGGPGPRGRHVQLRHLLHRQRGQALRVRLRDGPRDRPQVGRGRRLVLAMPNSPHQPGHAARRLGGWQLVRPGQQHHVAHPRQRQDHLVPLQQGLPQEVDRGRGGEEEREGSKGRKGKDIVFPAGSWPPHKHPVCLTPAMPR